MTRRGGLLKLSRPRVVLSERSSPGGLRRLLGLLPVQGALLALDTMYDTVRYLRYFTPLRTRRLERRRLEALLFVHFHKIEKTLALANPPRLFGTGYLGDLLNLLDEWERSIGDPSAAAFQGAIGALREYGRRVGEELKRESPRLLERLESRLAKDRGESSRDAIGGTRCMTAVELRAALAGADFERLAQLRHSVREFGPEPIPDDALRRAVQIAQRTPSVCNRQAWRVHVYTSPHDREMVLGVQDGNAGFGHLASRVLLVSADSRAYVTSGERHQAYVDGGMFAMSLVYALQSQGIASCCLNLCNYFFQDFAVHRACRIPPWEVPVMMIAVGYPPAEFRVAASPRLETDAVLAWRAL